MDSFPANVIAESQTSNPSLKRTFNPLVTSGNAQRVTLLRDNLIGQVGHTTGAPRVQGPHYNGRPRGQCYLLPGRAAYSAWRSPRPRPSNDVKDSEKTEPLAIITGLQTQVMGP